MKRLAVPLALLTLSGVTVASAADHPMKALFPGTDTCYARTYTPQHLKAHPRQRIVSMQLVTPFPYAFDEAPFLFGLSFKIRAKGRSYGPISTYCNGVSDTELACTVEADGGRFRIERGKGDTIILKIDRIQVEGQEDFSPEIGRGGDDNTIVLQKAPMSACPSNKRSD